MKIAHWTVVTPHRCGLYETTREIVAGLRNLGIDSRLVDPDRESNTLHPMRAEDRGAVIASPEWAMTADLFINHSGLGEWEKKTTQPIIHVAHGRPRYSYLSEKNGGTPVLSYHYAKGKDPRFKALVTFWHEHAQAHEVFWPRVEVIQPPVDLDFWNPEGPKHFKSGENFVITDGWREDIDPYICVLAFIRYNRKYPGAKLHIYGAPAKTKGIGPLLKILQDEGGLGEVKGWTKGLETVYRSATVLLTPHDIDTRAIREAAACGCPVYRVRAYTSPEMIRAALKSTPNMREIAEKRYNPEVTAKQFIELIHGVIR